MKDRELFPSKASNTSHRRTDAFDAADETADLFAGKFAVPFTDGASDHMRSSGALSDRITSSKNRKGITSSRMDVEDQGVSIRGASSQDISIKGMAKMKELFPDKLGGNAGKELFGSRLTGR